MPISGVFEIKLGAVAKHTSILLGDYFDNFITPQIKTGKFP